MGGTLHFHLFKGADLKYGNNFSNLKTKITQTRHFSFQVWKIFVLHKILLNDIFEGAECAWICVKHYESK